MKNQIFNPYLPLNEYVPDGEPHVFGDRIYIFGSHDKENGEVYCMLDYVSYSAPLSDLSDWRSEGVIYERKQDPHYDDNVYLWAPDVCQGPDGRYYLYYILSTELEIAVAVCDTPAGKYQYLGRVSYADGTVFRENIPFDPGVLNDDGKIWLYYGFAPDFPIPRMAGQEMPGASVVELSEDMLTVISKPKVVIPSKKYAIGTTFEGHGFFEACSIRKIHQIYHLIYSSENHHELCYCISDRPDGGFRYGGVVISNADLGYQGNTLPLTNYANDHGGLECVDGQWYIFYHRHTHGHQCSRQGCAEPVELAADGSVQQVEMTSSGLNNGPLEGKGTYSGALACDLYGKEGGKALIYGKYLEGEPCIFNEGPDYYIRDLSDGCVAAFKYFDIRSVSRVTVSVRGDAGTLKISDGKQGIARLPLPGSEDFKEVTGDLKTAGGILPLIFTYEGTGRIDLLSFRLD
jgi:hypothetical protein